MAELAMRLAPDPETGVFDTARTAIVITDPGFFPDLSDAFSNLTQENGDRLPVYNPGGILLNRLQIVPLLNGLQSFLHGDAPSAECAGQLIRNESFLQFLSAKMNCPEDDVLAAADRYFQMRLPDVLTEENLSEPEAAYLKYLSEDDAKALKLFLRTMREILQRREQIKKTQHSIPAIRSMLTDVFCQSSYDDRLGIPFEDEAESVKGVLSDFETSPVLSILPAEETLYLLSETLSKRILYPEHAPDALEIIGFLELPFCSAERVILCGMNEGFLPEIIAPTPFLNDSIRTRLGLPNNATRYARDCFYLKDLLERTGGNIHFISVKTDEDGAPMRFSTLLFAPLNDFTELRKRAAVLFETYPDQPSGNDPGSLADAVPFHASIDLTGAFRQGNGIVLNVTDFKELLASPLRTYFNKK